MSSEKKPGWKRLPIGAVITEAGSSRKFMTGDWRAFRPQVDKEKCVNCLLCWIYCPDSAVVRNEKGIEVNLDYCKGCGICAHECPRQAIKMVEEKR